ALLRGLDLLRDGDVVGQRDQDEEAAGERDVGRDAGAFRRDRLLGDFDDELLVLLEVGLGARPARPGATGIARARAAASVGASARCPVAVPLRLGLRLGGAPVSGAAGSARPTAPAPSPAARCPAGAAAALLLFFLFLFAEVGVGAAGLRREVDDEAGGCARGLGLRGGLGPGSRAGLLRAAIHLLGLGFGLLGLRLL